MNWWIIGLAVMPIAVSGIYILIASLKILWVAVSPKKRVLESVFSVSGNLTVPQINSVAIGRLGLQKVAHAQNDDEVSGRLVYLRK